MNFLTNLISIVIPRFRDFRGVSDTKFDKFGNYSLGIREQILFPEIEYSKVEKVRGLVITIVFKNSNPEKSKKYLKIIGLPFQEKDEN